MVQISRFRESEFYGTIDKLVAIRDRRTKPSQLPLDKLSRQFEKSVLNDRDAPVPDCMRCGACCAFPVIVTVTQAESVSLTSYWDIAPDDLEEVTINRALPRSMETGHCSFLEGDLGDKLSCEIYAKRPYACSGFEAGSDKCHAYRRMYGFEPQLGDTEIAAALERLESRRPRQEISAVRTIVERVSKTFDHDGKLLSTGGTLKIVVFIDSDRTTAHHLHSYDPEKETWFENEFLTLTLDEARALVSRTGKAS